MPPGGAGSCEWLAASTQAGREVVPLTTSNLASALGNGDGVPHWSDSPESHGMLVAKIGTHNLVTLVLLHFPQH